MWKKEKKSLANMLLEARTHKTGEASIRIECTGRIENEH